MMNVTQWATFDAISETVAVSDVFAGETVYYADEPDPSFMSQLWPSVSGGVAYVMFGGYSDYSGSLIDVSNAECLQHDYPDAGMSEVTGGHGSVSLVLPWDARIPVGLADAIAGLREYPVYDEDDWSRREFDLVGETVTESWFLSDLRSDVERAGIDVSDVSDAVLVEHVHTALSLCNDSPYAESVGSVVFPSELPSIVAELVTSGGE